ncbi:MAG: hypothetical protein JWP94_3440 [Mucilaginibacter sp.]|nr:hypothetical protein [Mucilaginibacter sp.]
MKKFLLLGISIFLLKSLAIAQFKCATPTVPSGKIVSKSSKVLSLAAAQPDGSYSINVFFHIIRPSNGVGGISSSSLPALTTILTDAYSPINIKIVTAGFDYINNDAYINFVDSQYNNLIAINNKPNAINVYLLYNNPSAYGGKADGEPGHNVVVANQFAITSVVAHEIGHTLNLYHTFHGQELGGCAELANGSNCSTCGDYVCDTPADPYNPTSGTYPSSLNCIYTGQTGYNPDVTNYMCYSAPSCLNHFTTGQGNRMKDALLNASVLQPVILSINGVKSFCASATYTVDNLVPGETVVWSASPGGIVNLTTSGNQVTATEITPGSVTLSATVNGVVACTLNLTAGSPPMDYYTVRKQDNTAQFCTNSFGNWMTVEPQNLTDITYFQWGYVNMNTTDPPVVVNTAGGYTQDFTFSTAGTYEIYARGGNNCGLGSTQTTIVSVSDLCGGGGFGGLAVFPNPAGNSMTISTASASTNATPVTATNIVKQPFSYKVYNKLGKILKQGSSPTGDNAVVDTRDFPSDNYFLHVFIGQQEIQRQIIVQH